MSEQSIDTATRRAAGAVSRRASLLAMGGIALAALTATPSAAKGKKNGKDRKNRKKDNQDVVTPAPPAPTGPTGEQLAQARCAAQGVQCREFISSVCEGSDCVEILVCCDQFATCNAAAGLNCIFAPQE